MDLYGRLETDIRWPGRSRVRASVGEQKLVLAVVGE